MQNWNDGKAQEFKDRKVYDIGASTERRFGAAKAPATKAELAEKAKPAEGRMLLFTTATCPKCVMGKKFLNDAKLAYETIIVDKQPELARKYGVRQAPTLLILDGEGVTERVENPSNIRAFAEARGN